MAPDMPRTLFNGKIGSWKSTLGNNLMRRHHFLNSINGHSVTKTPEISHNDRRQVMVVDTPGLFDNHFTSEHVKEEIRRCIELMTPGTHVILYVIRIGRFTQEDIGVLETYTDMFGEGMFPYTIVVFTRYDNHWKQIEVKTKDKAIEDFSKSFPETVNHYLKRIKNRYIMLDTKGTDVEDETEALTFAIEKMITDNKNGFYSYQQFIDSNKPQLKAEGLGADENRRQKKKKKQKAANKQLFARKYLEDSF